MNCLCQKKALVKGMQSSNNFGTGVSLTDAEFNKLSKFVYSNFGINLTDAKRGLVQGRLQSVLRHHQMATFDEYYSAICRDKSGILVSELINKLSTNFTYFYRESDHFEFLMKEALPFVEQYQSSSKNDLRLWCAGCSSGEEPYSLMMVLREYFRDRYSSWSAGILATDISENALSTARRGMYTEEHMRKLPDGWLKRYFLHRGGNQYQIKPDVSGEVTFRRFNLMNSTFPFKQKFHIIFCRNVMIYFDKQTKEELIKKYADLLVPGGYLFIGHSETISRDIDVLSYVRPAIYRKVAS